MKCRFFFETHTREQKGVQSGREKCASKCDKKEKTNYILSKRKRQTQVGALIDFGEIPATEAR